MAEYVDDFLQCVVSYQKKKKFYSVIYDLLLCFLNNLRLFIGEKFGLQLN